MRTIITIASRSESRSLRLGLMVVVAIGVILRQVSNVDL